MRSSSVENLSEHSAQSAMLAHALAVIGNTFFSKSFNPERAAILALFHDSSEVITGDLPAPIKYFNPEINAAYKGLEKVANDKLVSMLPKQMQQHYGELLNADKDMPENLLVKHADKLCAYLKCVEETKTGNSEFIRAKNIILADLKSRNSEEVNYFLENFASGYELTLDELES